MIVLEYLTVDQLPQTLEATIQYIPDPEGTVPRHTMVQLLTVDGRLAALGTSSTHPADQFSKRLGRKLAFQRAVENYTDDRKIRRQLWDSFRAQVAI